MEIPWTIVGDVGAGALLALTIWLILTGRLIPKSLHDTQLAEVSRSRDYWRDASAALSKTNEILSETVRETATVGATVKKVMESLQSSNRDDGDDE